ncbi:MAG: MBL fold metallo-hydrolase [Planctomycetes bacterium]|nr:MBL fold metallo-hydrolase [Planctomycetota bacterium]
MKYGGNTSCYIVQLDDPQLPTFILDSGTGIREAGFSLLGQAKGKPLDLVLLFSHTHWDHINGFPFFVPIYIPGNKLQLYGPFSFASAEKSFKEIMDLQMSHDYFPVRADDLASTITYNDLKEKDNKLNFGEVVVKFFYVNHTVQCLGYRIEHGGKSMVYTGDHEPYFNYMRLDPGFDPEKLSDEEKEQFEEINFIVDQRNKQVAEFCRGADLLIIDSQYVPQKDFPNGYQTYETKLNWGHSCVTDSLDLAMNANVGKVVLTHHEPLHTDEQIDYVLEYSKNYVADKGGSVDVHMAVEKQEFEL